MTKEMMEHHTSFHAMLSALVETIQILVNLTGQNLDVRGSANIDYKEI